MIGRPTARGLLVAGLLLAATAAGTFLTPQPTVTPGSVPDWRTALPERIGEWTAVPTPGDTVDLTPEGARDGQDYDIIVQRSFINPRGEILHVALGYGREQRHERKLHRPELCYAAAGFRVAQRHSDRIMTDSGQTVSVVRLLAASPRRNESVTYWMRVGEHYIDNPWQFRGTIFTEALRRRIADGLLVRISSSGATPAAARSAFALHDQWIDALSRTLDPAARRWWFAAG